MELTVDITLGRRANKKAQVRARLLSVSLALFRARGVDGTTVDDITLAADTAKGTFFNYFPTKEHVLIAFYDDLLGKALHSTSEQRIVHSAAARITRLLCACARQVEPELPLARALLRALFSSAAVAQADRDIEERIGEVLFNALKAGIAQKEFRADLELSVFGSLLTAALSTSIQDWVRDEGGHDLQASLRRKLRVLFRAAQL